MILDQVEQAVFLRVAQARTDDGGVTPGSPALAGPWRDGHVQQGFEPAG